MRPPRVRTHSFPPSIRRIYTSGPCSCWASSCFADLPTFVCLMRFLFVGSVVCRRLPSAHASRRRPCHWLCAWRYLLHSGLAPIRTRPCRAHKKSADLQGASRFSLIRMDRNRSEFRRQSLYDFARIRHEPVVAHFKNRCFRIIVDGHDHFGVLHPGYVLDRPGNSERDI